MPKQLCPRPNNGRGQPPCRRRIDGLSVGLRSVDDNAMRAVENRQVDSLSTQSCQRIHEGLCFTMQVHVCQYNTAQLE